MSLLRSKTVSVLDLCILVTSSVSVFPLPTSILCMYTPILPPPLFSSIIKSYKFMLILLKTKNNFGVAQSVNRAKVAGQCHLFLHKWYTRTQTLLASIHGQDVFHLLFLSYPIGGCLTAHLRRLANWYKGEGSVDSSPCWPNLPLEPELYYHCVTSPPPWGGEGLISFYTSRKQFITGRNQGRSRTMEDYSLLAHLFLLAQLTFLHRPGQLCPRIHCPQCTSSMSN